MYHRASAGLAAAVVGLSVALAPIAAGAHPSRSAIVPRPAAPSGIRIATVSPDSFTITAKPAAHAQSYRLYASTVRSNLFTANVRNALHSAWKSTPRLTIGGLSYTTAPYYFRLEALNSKRTKFSTEIGEVGLQPATPTGLVATANHQKSFLSWGSRNGTGYQVERATNPAMTSGVHLNTITGPLTDYTPLGLQSGHSYYFRVRTLNDATHSAWSAAVPMTSRVSSFDIRVMTYNVIEARLDGRHEGGNIVAPWSKRRPAIIKTINEAQPDVIGLQEAATFVGSKPFVRQVDSLRNGMPGYAEANTEIKPGTPGWRRTGVYILFRKSTYSRVGAGGNWDIGSARWAVYQELKNRATGAHFLFVSVHERMQQGRANDIKRQQETQRLLSDAHAMAARDGGIPIVYVGDFNSDQYARHAFNAPLIVMNKAGVADAYQVAPKRIHGQYNTANNYQTRPPKNAAHIDYVFAPPGIGVRSWILEMRLAHGKFVGTIPSDHDALVSDLTIPYS